MNPGRTLARCALVSFLFTSACVDQPTATEPLDDAPEETFPPPAPRALAVEGYQTPGELRTGYIYGPGGTPIQVTYEVHGDLAVWEGDIYLGRAGTIPTSEAELIAAEGPLRAAAIDGDGFRWPGGVIPYEIANDLPRQSRVTDAITMVESQTPGVTLLPRSGEDEYVRFILPDDDVCMSAVGMQDDGQTIRIGPSCSTGNTAHEILHAAGLFHEQSRCDRDTFVEIVWDNILDDKKGNFDKHCDDGTDYDQYDEGSIMHYGPFAFAIDDTQPTIISKRGRDALMGQRGALGPTDISTIALLYGANNQPPTAVIAPLAASYPEGSNVALDGSGSSDPDDEVLNFSWTFGDGPCVILDCRIPTTKHRYGDDGTYDVRLVVSDGFLSRSDAVEVTITNVAPTLDLGSPINTTEGRQVLRGGSFTDPGADDSWTGTVSWGDGSAQEALLVDQNYMLFDLLHTFLDNGSYTTHVEISDDDGGVGADDLSATITNVAPSVQVGPNAEVVSGETYDLTGNFSDPGILDAPWDWEVDWGFGTDATGSTNDQSASIETSVQVCLAGTYQVTLSVTDKDGGTGSDDLTLTVPHEVASIDITPGGDPNPVNLRGRGTLPVALLSTATFDATAVDPMSITLGDGNGAETPAATRNNGMDRLSVEDVNDDGLLDLVAMFNVQDLVANGDLDDGTSELFLTGLAGDGCTNFRGMDTVVPIS